MTPCSAWLKNSHVEDENRRRLTPQHFFRPADEMRALFADLPEAVDNTVMVARRCAVMAPERKPILPVFPTAADGSEADALRARAGEGLERRLEAELYRDDQDSAAREAAAAPYRARLAYELDVIVEMHFAGYFLIVADIVRWARGEGIPVGPGRGSGAGSVVAWALTVTDLDPLRFGLLFERFLNPERVSMPDFDIDFCPERRDEVIDYVCRRYGEDRVAQIITFGKLQARAVLRDVGRVLGLGYGRVDHLCKLVPYNPANPVTLQQALDSEPRLAEERDNDETVARLIEISLQLEGLYRHASTHAAGIVIADRPLSELVPLYRDPRSEMPATQFSMKYAEMSGLVKFDLLGLKTLTVLDHASAILREAGIEIDLAALPLDDEATYEMLGRGAAMGVFQLESAGMRDALRSLKPDCIEDIIALVALYRPGPMDNIPRYIACKHGREKPDYLHPKLTGILEETFGVIIYQEQVMEIAKVLANYSLGGADLLRRAMGKKIKAEMDAQRETFVKGALANDVARSDASRIFELVAKFAGYGFNKSHAAAYALVAYQTAYLKANHPVEFLAASMSLEVNNIDRLELFRRELERLGIPLLPPDINASRATFSVEHQADGTKAIRYALGAIRNVGVQAMVALTDERVENGPYRDPFDIASRIDPHQINRRQIENLAKAGAFDCLVTNRRQVADGAEVLLAFSNAAQLSRTQSSLFDGADATLAPRPSLPEQEDWEQNERLAAEQEAVGFYLSAHPLDSYEDALMGLSVTPSAQVAQQLASGITRFRLAGVVLSVRERGPGSRRYAFIQLSDASGSYEVAAFRETYGDGRGVLEPGKPVLVTAQARLEGEDVKLSAQSFDDLDARLSQNFTGLAVHVLDTDAIEPLSAILANRQEGSGRIALFVETGDAGTVEIELPHGLCTQPLSQRRDRRAGRGLCRSRTLVSTARLSSASGLARRGRRRYQAPTCKAQEFTRGKRRSSVVCRSGARSIQGMIRGGGTGERTANGFARIHHAPASRSRRAFWAPDAALEPEDAALSVRRAQRRPRYRSGADRAPASPGAGRAARRGRRGRAHPLRRHQAAGLQANCGDRAALRPVLCKPPLAGRHADELEGDFRLDQDARRSRIDACRRGCGPDQEGDAAAGPPPQ